MHRLEPEVTHNIRVESIAPLPSPADLKKEFPLTSSAWETVREGRETMIRVLAGQDTRLVVVVGPCSVHNPREVLEYATLLAAFSKLLKDRIYIMIRLCCDKPRTRKAWPGFFTDPRLDGSCDMASGWREARQLMLAVAEMGLPIAVEFLDADNFQNVDDLVSNAWIGARTVQSQKHRQQASALSTPVGFKNPTQGTVKDAIDAIEFARHGHVFVASNDGGIRSRFATAGNPWGYLVHRGFEEKTNYDDTSISRSVELLRSFGLVSRIAVDVSHGNSGKDHARQEQVIMELVQQITAGSPSIAAIFYESYLEAGKQSIPRDLSDLKPRVSVTDGCDSWETTKRVLTKVHRQLGKIRKRKN